MEIKVQAIKGVATITKVDDDNVLLTRVDGYEHSRRLYERKIKNDWIFAFRKKAYSCRFDENNEAYDIVDRGFYQDFVKQEKEELKQQEQQQEKYEHKGYVVHKEFETIKACVENDIPVYLVGPAGSGKNHTLQQIATELGLDFYFTNAVQQEFKVTGFIDAGGTFHETEFYKAFKDGGLFFLDEMDASIPEVLVLLNAAIANRYFEFPNGKINAHPDFRIVAAGNTVGDGADEQYTGRLTLDQSSLDRFAVIEFDYDRNIEMALAKGNKELVDFINELRSECKSIGIRATFSYRAIISVEKLEKALPLEKVMVIAVVKGMDKDTIKTIRPVNISNKYWKALKAIA